MEQQHRRGIARPFVDIMLARGQPVAEIDLEPMFGEGIIGNVGKAFGGRAQDLHRSLLQRRPTTRS